MGLNPMIEFQDVVRIYGQGEALQYAVNHVSFQINEGEFVMQGDPVEVIEKYEEFMDNEQAAAKEAKEAAKAAKAAKEKAAKEKAEKEKKAAEQAKKEPASAAKE